MLKMESCADHQVVYFVNGHPVQNEIIPKPEGIKTVVLTANTQHSGLRAIAFTALQTQSSSPVFCSFSSRW